MQIKTNRGFRPVQVVACIVSSLMLLLFTANASLAQSVVDRCGEYNGSDRCSAPIAFVASQAGEISGTNIRDESGYAYSFCACITSTPTALAGLCENFQLGEWRGTSANPSCVVPGTSQQILFPAGNDVLIERIQNYEANENKAFNSILEEPCSATLLDTRWHAQGEGYTSERRCTGMCGAPLPTWKGGLEEIGRGIATFEVTYKDATGACSLSKIVDRPVTRSREVAFRCPAGAIPVSANGNVVGPNSTPAACIWDEARGCGYGNPVQPENGCKVQRETDYSGPSGLELQRVYESAGLGFRPVDEGGWIEQPGSLGSHWQTNYALTLHVLDNPGALGALHMPDGKVRYFDENGREKNRYGKLQATLRALTTTTGVRTGFILTESSGNSVVFNLGGKPVRMSDSNGLHTTLLYSTATTPAAIAPEPGLLIRVTGPYGHTLQFIYNSNAMLSRVIDPAGRQIGYFYDSDVLTQVAWPDGSTRDYRYADPNRPKLLTDIIKTDGSVFAHFEYDSNNRATRTGRGHVAGVSTSHQLDFNYVNDSTVTLTDANNTRRTLTLEREHGVINITSELFDDGFGTLSEYDSENRLVRRINRNQDAERVTEYEYNAAHQLISTTEAAGTGIEQETRFSYLRADREQITRIERPSIHASEVAVESHVYDQKLNRIATVRSGYLPGGTPMRRITRYQYDSSGRLIRVIGPRPDAADDSRFTWYNCRAGNQCGQLHSFTNALGHRTVYDRYDGHGRPGRIVHADGSSQWLNYDQQGRVIMIRKVGAGDPISQARITRHVYNTNGQKLRTITPTGLSLIYRYDDADQLTSVTDDLGNVIEYTWDARGNRTSETIRTVSQTDFVKQVRYEFDLRNYLSVTRLVNTARQSRHDSLGNVIEEQDANGNPASQNRYDALNRLVEIIDRAGNRTTYVYDRASNLTAATSPNGLTTTFLYDDFGNRILEKSPDRGVVRYTFDAADNTVWRIDGRGTRTQYRHDALNRIVSVDFAGTREDIRFTWDNCTNGIGRICIVSDESGTTRFGYDGHGNVSSETRVIDGQTFTTRYRYDAEDRVRQLIYPNGRQVDYTRDKRGRITSVVTTMDGRRTRLVTARRYRPDDLVTHQILANQLRDMREYNTRGELVRQSLLRGAAPVWSREYEYDSNGNPLTVDETTGERQYQFDSLDRLIGENTAATTPGAALPVIAYEYDANGNRLSIESNGATTDYTIASASNRIATTTGESFVNGQGGYTTSDRNGARRYVWNQRGNMATLYRNGRPWTNYRYDFRNLRVIKESIANRNRTSRRLHFYDQQGNIIAEFDSGQWVRDYVWLDAEPLRQSELTSTSAGNARELSAVTIISDFNGTPKLITAANGAIVTRLDSDGFGRVYRDPAAAKHPLNYPLRFPGQYYDTESGLHYNWHRYYDPVHGRYLSSDPLGLFDGMNTYVYAHNRPLTEFDPTGLATCGTGWNEPLIPDNPLWFRFGDCCGAHDDCYDTCDPSLTRADCDGTFCDCMGTVCEKTNGGAAVCRFLARRYCNATRKHGQAAYDAARATCTSCN